MINPTVMTSTDPLVIFIMTIITITLMKPTKTLRIKNPLKFSLSSRFSSSEN